MGRFYPEFFVGSGGTLAALTVNEWAALCVAGVTILTMLPLAFWRWRNLITGSKPPRDERP